MNKQFLKQLIFSLAALFAVLTYPVSHAASGEMGSCIPVFGIYTQAVAPGQTIVFGMMSPTVVFPAGCTWVTLTKATMGDDYKMAVATLMLAKSTGKAVRLFAHAERDGGCGVDYVQLL